MEVKKRVEIPPFEIVANPRIYWESWLVWLWEMVMTSQLPDHPDFEKAFADAWEHQSSGIKFNILGRDGIQPK